MKAQHKAPPTIEMQEVQSSQIASIGHDPASNTLRVKFKGSGSTYDYAGVSAEDHQAFVNAESIGKHFGANVKGRFEFKKLPSEKKAEA